MVLGNTHCDALSPFIEVLQKSKVALFGYGMATTVVADYR